MWMFVALGVIVIFWLWNVCKKPPGLPPGPWGLPLIGYLPVSLKNPDDYVSVLRKKYGNIFLWRLGTRNIMFLFDYHTIRGVFGKHEYTTRPELVIFKFMDKGNYGLIGSNDSVWHNGRRFALRHLRDLGMGKSSLVEAVQQEALYLVDDLKSKAGESTPLPDSLNVCVLNIIWKMVANTRYNADHPRLKHFRTKVREIQQQLVPLLAADLLPWLDAIIPDFIGRKIFQKQALRNFTIDIKKFFMEIIDDHERRLDADNPMDYIDLYLLEMKKETDSTFSKEDLIVSITDLFLAGSETTTVTLTWIIYYLANYPEIQQKLQKEIDEVLPRGVLATIEDKPRLPYTEAVIHEVHRIASMLNFGVMHEVAQDTELEGYRIPKGTIVTGGFAWVHHDPRYWDKPEKFRPERFLDATGKFVPKKEGLLPFGVGKRQCLGEPLARMELLIFLTTIMQSLSVSVPKGKEVSLEPVVTPFNHLPKPGQEILITLRQ